MKKFSRVVAGFLLLFLMLVGIVPAQAAPVQQAEFAVPILVVNTSFLNVRSGPGVQYTAVATLLGGTELPVLGIAKDRVWYFVSSYVGNGWVNIQYVLPRGNFTNVPQLDLSFVAASVASAPVGPVSISLLGQGGGAPLPAQSSAPAGSFARYRAVLIAESGDVKSSPSRSAGNVTSIYKNFTVDYPIYSQTFADGVAWFQIEVQGAGTGWIEQTKVSQRLSGLVGTVMNVIPAATGIDLDGGGTDVLSNGDEGFLLGYGDGGRVHIELPDGRTAWVNGDDIQPRLGTTTDGHVGAGVRPPAGVTTTTGDQGGGAPALYLPAVSVPRVIVNTGNLNVRSGPGAQYTSIFVAPGGTELHVIGVTKDRIWYLVEGSFGQGWLNRDYVIFRGSMDYVPVILNAYKLGGGGTVDTTGAVG